MTTASLVRYHPVLAAWRMKSLYSVLQLIGASLFIGICAQISVPIYFTPVPLSLQTFAVLLVGALLGSRRGALAVLLYIAEGCMGLPVFAGGHFGILTLLGPKGGYLVGFIFQAYIIGYFFHAKTAFNVTKTLVVASCAGLIQLSVGSLWLVQFVGWNYVLQMGFFPFILGDFIKALIGTHCLRKLNDEG